jgi:hypothetical protein
MPHMKPAVACLLALAVCGGCARRERPEHARARSTERFLREQIIDIERTIGRVERGEITTTDQLAVGVSEDLAKDLLNASLPLATTVAERLRVTVSSAEPIFRGGKAALLFQARVASVDLPDASVSLEIAGALDDFVLADGRLKARVALAHFAVQDSGVGDLAADVIDALVRANVDTIQQAIPPLEFPVQLEQAIAIGGLTEGAVIARPGALPLEVKVSQVIVGSRRLWVLLDAQAGSWEPVAAQTPPAEEGP